MSVSDGQRVNAAVTNAAYLSRTTDSDTTGVIGLNNPGSGGSIANAQQQINDNTANITSNDGEIAALQSGKTDKATLTTKADIYVRDGSEVTRQGVGTDGQVLSANSAESTGLEWIDLPGSELTTKGDLLTRDASSTVRLGVGTDNQVLVADSAEASGLRWADPTSGTSTLVTSTITTTTTASTSVDVYLCDTSGGAFTVTLPTAASADGKVFYFKFIDSGTNILTVDADGSETIDGVADFKLSGQNEYANIVSNGTNWEVIGSTHLIDQFLEQESITLTPGSSNVYFQFTDNSVTLTPGSWRLTGGVYFDANASPGYTFYRVLWGLANGNNTSTKPTTIETIYDAGQSFSFGNQMTIPSQDAVFVNGPENRVTVTTTTTVYLNAFATIATPAGADITTFIWAERLA